MTTSLRRLAVAAALATSALAIGAGTASAGSVVYSGQGIDDAGALESVVCGTENGAEAEGGYVLFILTGNVSGPVSFDAGDGEAGLMQQSGNGAFKFIYTGESDLLDLVGQATATYEGSVRGNPQLVISHGCPGDDTPPS